ncbi:hypothetical protein PVAP13_1KG160905 [Panicum virgatum]|uniref:Uncharacterized protein n=1 Tax=Panicum virgatum TaxID=38727 RepID=A0A8T0XCX4_PANVG|nr:hypothetical protein PVAP13_1KG160905 [Panicum virgatum]
MIKWETACPRIIIIFYKYPLLSCLRLPYPALQCRIKGPNRRSGLPISAPPPPDLRLRPRRRLSPPPAPPLPGVRPCRRLPTLTRPRRSKEREELHGAAFVAPALFGKAPRAVPRATAAGALPNGGFGTGFKSGAAVGALRGLYWRGEAPKPWLRPAPGSRCPFCTRTQHRGGRAQPLDACRWWSRVGGGPRRRDLRGGGGRPRQPEPQRRCGPGDPPPPPEQDEEAEDAVTPRPTRGAGRIRRRRWPAAARSAEDVAGGGCTKEVAGGRPLCAACGEQKRWRRRQPNGPPRSSYTEWRGATLSGGEEWATTNVGSCAAGRGRAADQARRAYHAAPAELATPCPPTELTTLRPPSELTTPPRPASQRAAAVRLHLADGSRRHRAPPPRPAPLRLRGPPPPCRHIARSHCPPSRPLTAPAARRRG